jgi:hypothetical protein
VCDCSQMHGKVSSDWLPSYIKAKRTALEIFKMAGYFPGRPRICICTCICMCICICVCVCIRIRIHICIYIYIYIYIYVPTCIHTNVLWIHKCV